MAEQELIEALMVAAMQDRWPEFLQALAQEIGAEGLGLAVLGGEALRHGAALVLPEASVLARLRLDRVYSQDDLPWAEGNLRAMRVALPEGGSALLWARRNGEFRAVAGARLAGLGRLIARALGEWRKLRAERELSTLDRLGAEGLGLGWVLFSAGRVQAASPLGRRLAAQYGLRLRQDGGWEARSETVERRLRQGLSDLSLEVVALPELGGSLRSTPQGAVLWLRAASGPALEALIALGMSRSEARLAVQLVAGESLQQAAIALGWTIETTRSCSKQIFARLGTGGQADTLRYLLGLALW